MTARARAALRHCFLFLATVLTTRMTPTAWKSAFSRCRGVRTEAQTSTTSSRADGVPSCAAPLQPAAASELLSGSLFEPIEVSLMPEAAASSAECAPAAAAALQSALARHPAIAACLSEAASEQAGADAAGGKRANSDWVLKLLQQTPTAFEWASSLLQVGEMRRWKWGEGRGREGGGGRQ